MTWHQIGGINGAMSIHLGVSWFNTKSTLYANIISPKYAESLQVSLETSARWIGSAHRLSLYLPELEQVRQLSDRCFL